MSHEDLLYYLREPGLSTLGTQAQAYISMFPLIKSKMRENGKYSERDRLPEEEVVVEDSTVLVHTSRGRRILFFRLS
jgi:hypothetical protein